ncbi:MULTISPECIES: response regulator [unclassified Rhizobium]
MEDRIVVLVVEDEAIIRMALVSALEDAGFEVFDAQNADTAIDCLILNTKIQVVFTDIEMPGSIDGLKLAAAISDGWPPIKIIVTSGYHAIEPGTLPVEGLFLAKPYHTADVVESIHQLMAA